MKQFRMVLVVGLLFALLAAAAPAPVSAEQLQTTTFTSCVSFEKLKDAVLNDRVVNFNLPYSCTIRFDESITISGYAIISNVGNYDLTFHGNADDHDEDDDTHFFSVLSGAGLEINNIQMTYGKGNLGGAISISEGYLVLEGVTMNKNIAQERGGAIYMSGGDVEIRNSYIYENGTVSIQDGSTGSGGAIYASNFYDSSRLLILNSTFYNNQTGDSLYEDTGRGGGLYLYDVSGSMLVNIFNSTFYRNQTGDSSRGSVGDGGAIYANDYAGSLTLNIFNSTFSKNGLGSASSGDPGIGSTIYLREAAMNLAGSILANGFSSYGNAGFDCAIRGDVSIEDGGYNIVENMGDCKEYLPNSKEIDPGLHSSLGNYGSDVPVIALSGGGYAVDKIPVGVSAFGVNICGYDYAAEDQRGELRPGGNYCDIGAYEIIDDNHPFTLPSTGFAPGVVTVLSEPKIEYQSVLADADDGKMVLSIPSLGASGEIVGVPQNGFGWDVEWLGDNVGYLNGTSFPTWDGNTVLTGHAANNLGQAGTFADLEDLRYGDTIIISAWGQEYVYSVREHYQTGVNDTSVVEKSDQNMLTLVTCMAFDAESNSYPLRDVVVAVLIAVR